MVPDRQEAAHIQETLYTRTLISPYFPLPSPTSSNPIPRPRLPPFSLYEYVHLRQQKQAVSNIASQ